MVNRTSGMKRLSTDFGNGNVRMATGHSARLELGAWSLELGAWSLELGAWSWELGAGSWELGAGSWELGAGSYGC
jgi:hypothetical protein